MKRAFLLVALLFSASALAQVTSIRSSAIDLATGIACFNAIDRAEKISTGFAKGFVALNGKIGHVEGAFLYS